MIRYQDKIKLLKKLADSGKLSHAYLFFGGNREEKIVFAQSLANSEETLIIEPDEKGTIGIDIIRSLKYFLWQKPARPPCFATRSGQANSKLRTVIIKEAENLTNQAQNAALKIVEEPPESALIIFIVKNVENLLPTLTSRLQKIHFPEIEMRKMSIQTNDTNSINNDIDIDYFFKNLIGDLKKDPIKNSQRLKEILKRLVLIKQFNVNKRLQIKAIQQ
jgi:DNA polymerase III gamma/tau subunit